MIKFILVRHGQSEANKIRIFAGHYDYPLTEYGREQASACADALKDEQIDICYSSDLLRAYDTALAHLKYHTFEIIKDTRLREIEAGDWSDKDYGYIGSKYPELYPNVWYNDFENFACPLGESTKEVGLRGMAALCDIAKQHKDGTTILITSHCVFIRSTVKECIKSDYDKITWPTNASYTELYYDNGKFTLGKFSVNHYIDKIDIPLA